MAIYFNDLWLNHPSNQTPPENSPCKKSNGSTAFTNQCVIRLGESLTASGVNLASFRGAFCWHGHGKRHPLRVEQFKDWVDSDDATFAPYYAQKYTRPRRGTQKTYHHFLGHKGIVACLDFHGRSGRGDHIDLWDGLTMAHGGRDYFERSREIWFWHIP